MSQSASPDRSADRSKLLRDEMDAVSLALNPSIDGHHRRPQDNALGRSNRLGRTTRLAGPVSSSIVMNITPWVESGIWRTNEARPSSAGARRARSWRRAGDDAAFRQIFAQEGNRMRPKGQPRVPKGRPTLFARVARRPLLQSFSRLPLRHNFAPDVSWHKSCL